MLNQGEGDNLKDGWSTDILLLAAGTSSRMGGEDKLLNRINGVPILRYMANTAIESNAQAVHVVLGYNSSRRAECLDGLELKSYFFADYHYGMGASISFGIRRIRSRAESVIILLADMPRIKSNDLNRLICSYRRDLGREICVATTSDGVQGNPVLFGQRFFTKLANLKNEKGAKGVLMENHEFVWPVVTSGNSAVLDIDTKEDWKKFLNSECH